MYGEATRGLESQGEVRKQTRNDRRRTREEISTGDDYGKGGGRNLLRSQHRDDLDFRVLLRRLRTIEWEERI